MAKDHQEFDRLKQKYQPALHLMQQLEMQVQVQTINNTKLIIHGVAPSAEVKNRIWDQIKLIDATFSDLVCDIRVSQQPRQPVAQQAPATMTAGASASGGKTSGAISSNRAILSTKSATGSMGIPISTRKYLMPIEMSCGI
jgi:hypothetical protein